MMQQFRQLLNSPKAQTSNILQNIQNLIYTSFETMFSEDFDFTGLQEIYCDILGDNAFATEEVSIALDEHALLIYKIVDYFIRCIKQNFIPVQTYNALEGQTQKAEGTVRFHIKIQHEMKMYLDYLEAKLEKYQLMLDSNRGTDDELKRQLKLLINKEDILQKQKLNLLKKNEQFKLQIEQLQTQLEAQSNGTTIIHNQPHLYFDKDLSAYSNNHQLHQSDQRGEVSDEKIRGLKNSSIVKDNNMEYISISHDYNNELTQKKKSHFFK